MNFKILGLFILIIIVAIGAYTFGSSSNNSNSVSSTTQPVENDVVPNQTVIKSFFEVHEIKSDYQELLGKTIETRGIVKSLNESKGNVYFNLKDPKTGKEIRCVLFAKTNNDAPERKILLLKSRDNNSVVNIKDEVAICKGELEIKVWQVYL